MACPNPLEKAKELMPNERAKEAEEDFFEGIVEGLKDFSKIRYIVFEDDEELEDHMMNL